MENGRNDGFGQEYEVNSHRSHLSGYVLVAGLVLEIVNSVIWYRGPETIAEIIAVLLIVGGVWGEIFFGHKARLAGDKQLAQYEARTAEANEKAAAAQLELVKFRAPRRSLMTNDAKTRIADKLRPFSGINFDIGMGEGDGEQADFVWDLEHVLKSSGWRQAHWGVHGVGISAIVRMGQPVLGSVAAQNVEIHVDPVAKTELLPAAEALVSALQEGALKPERSRSTHTAPTPTHCIF